MPDPANGAPIGSLRRASEQLRHLIYELEDKEVLVVERPEDESIPLCHCDDRTARMAADLRRCRQTIEDAIRGAKQ